MQKEGTWTTPAKVTGIDPNFPRSYNLQTDNGWSIRGNRRHLKKWNEELNENDDGEFESHAEGENKEERERTYMPEESSASTASTTLTTQYGRRIRPPQRYGFS